MKLISVLFLLLVLTACSDNEQGSPQSPFRLQGDWESSGGDGVVCFESEVDRKKYESQIQAYNQLGNIPAEVKYTVETLEGFEMQPLIANSELVISKDLKQLKDSEKIVSQVVDRLRMFVPVFAQKLDLALEHINIGRWHASNKEILDIDDSTPMRPIGENCVIVQLADRQTQSKESHLPKAEVYFRQDLYEKMDALNQALLKTHESLYLIGRETGHTNSDDIRKVNIMLFSENFYEVPPDIYFSQQAREFQGHFISYFGDYIRFFTAEEFYNNPKDYSSILYSNNYTRHHSFVEMNSAFREFISQCESSGEAFNVCADRLMLGDDLVKHVNTDEKAFLFMMNYYFDPTGSPYVFSEQLYYLDFDNPKKQDEMIQLHLGAACGRTLAFVTKQLSQEIKYDLFGIPVLDDEDQNLIKAQFSQDIWFKDFITPALRYCKEVRVQLRKQPPTRLSDDVLE